MNKILQSAEVIRINDYKSMGIIGTIKFEKNVLPKIGDMIKYGEMVYKITGVVVSSSSEQLNANMDQNIFDCKLMVVF